MASCSNMDLSLEKRLEELHNALSKIKNLIQEQIRSEDSKWGHLNNALVVLCKEFTDAKEVGEDFIDSTKTQFKDQQIPMMILATD